MTLRPGSTAARAALLTVAAASLLFQPGLLAWGLRGHLIVTREAARRMPPDAPPLFAASGEALAVLSLEPDTVLKERDGKEAARHYVNLEDLDEPPFGGIPREKGRAARRFGGKKLERTGTLPWRILEAYRDLRASMGKPARDRILRDAGYLAHYVADLFQPLHVTANYDGRETCNHGIHEAFEREMIERIPGAYREGVSRGSGAARHLRRPAESVFGWMGESWTLADDILAADTAAVKALKSGRGDYFGSLESAAGSIARRQMSAAANALASLWYTAWVDAGRPDLP